jgi:tetratricopeptide (TPR) repeat protein
MSDLIEDAEEAAWVEEHVRALAGLESAARGGDERGREAAAAWRRFLEALAERHPLVLVFEDLHWADDALLDFIDHLVDWASGVPMLVVCTARPELLDRRREWGGGKRNALTVALSPLADADVARLIGTLLEQAVLPAETQATLLATAEGNPLYAEEYVRMLIDRGHLRHAGGRWRLAAGDLPVPESVHGLIAARLDDLPADQKQLLQDAAVLGKVVWLGALAAMGEADRFDVEARLHALERREMLRRERRSSVGGEVEFVFRHVLVRDVAYGQIPRAQRAEKHRRAAEWIESLSADRESAPDMVAHHYAQALDYARDAGHATEELERLTRIAFRDAAERAAALNSLASAERHYEAALALWPEADPEWPLLVVATSDVGGLSVSAVRATELLTRATERLIAAGDYANAARAEMLVAFRHWNRAKTAQAVAAYARSGELVERAEPSPTVAHVMSRLAIHAMLGGRYGATLELCDRAAAVAEQFGLELIRAHVLNTRGVARVNHGDSGGVADQEESIAIAERLSSAETQIRGYKNFGSTLMDLGDLPRAAEFEQRGADAARRFGAGFQVMWFETELGILAHWAGDWDAADAAFGRLDAYIAEVGPHYMEAAAHSVRAKLRVARGDVAGASRDIESALDFARRSLDPQVLLPTLADAALIAATRGGRDAARRVSALFDEAAGALQGDMSGVYWLVELALALALTDQPQRFAGLQAEGPWAWLAAARLIAAGRHAEAADQLAVIGARPEEALARLLAGRSLIGVGDRAGGEADLRRALAFWESVGAVTYAALAEALMAKTA